MNTLKVNIPEGYEIHNFNTETSEVTFKPVKQQITPEELFLQFFDGCVVRFDTEKYPDSIFYFDKSGNFLMEYNSKYNEFWVRYLTVWKVFETQFSLNFTSTKDLLNRLVREHFKLKKVTTKRTNRFVVVKVREHFKLKKVTTREELESMCIKVQEHFKLKKVTTMRE
jgi:hypothetical protein